MKIRRLVEIIILISHPWPHKLQLQQQQLQQQPAQIKSKRKKGEKEGKAHEIKWGILVRVEGIDCVFDRSQILIVNTFKAKQSQGGGGGGGGGWREQTTGSLYLSQWSELHGGSHLCPPPLAVLPEDPRIPRSSQVRGDPAVRTYEGEPFRPLCVGCSGAL